jgi:hypothetical protein
MSFEHCTISRIVEHKFDYLSTSAVLRLPALRAGGKASLHAGQDWQQALSWLLEKADLFQLFWSEAANQSPYVAEEWQHALLLQDRKGERFIRPLYWTSRWPTPPARLAQLRSQHSTLRPCPASRVSRDQDNLSASAPATVDVRS